MENHFVYVRYGVVDVDDGPQEPRRLPLGPLRNKGAVSVSAFDEIRPALQQGIFLYLIDSVFQIFKIRIYHGAQQPFRMNIGMRQPFKHKPASRQKQSG
jgi:hypothetical protein